MVFNEKFLGFLENCGFFIRLEIEGGSETLEIWTENFPPKMTVYPENSSNMKPTKPTVKWNEHFTKNGIPGVSFNNFI